MLISRSESGFTLIEIMVVLVIIALLTLAIYSFADLSVAEVEGGASANKAPPRIVVE